MDGGAEVNAGMDSCDVMLVRVCDAEVSCWGGGRLSREWRLSGSLQADEACGCCDAPLLGLSPVRLRVMSCDGSALLVWPLSLLYPLSSIWGCMGSTQRGEGEGGC